MDSFFPELAALIFKAGVFPNATVLVYTANFLELYVLVSLAAIKEGFPFNIRAVDQVLTPEKTCYYSNNNMRVNEYAAPFGENLCVDSTYDDWAESLKVGDKVDAIKAQSALTDAKMIWSRGVVTGVRPYYVTVSFYGENQTSLTDKFIKKTPYNLNKYGTRSVDFEWRENLKEGDTFDLYLGKRGWMLFTVESVITQWQEREIYKFVQASYKATSETPRSAAGEEDTPISKLNSYQAITVNVHDPVLRKPNTYSPLRYVGWQYCNDEVYEVCDPNIVAVTRIKGETDMMAPIVNSRYYLRFVNVFALQGGFEMMKKIFLWKEPPCSAQLVGYFMNIMANVAPFLLNRFVQKEGIVFAEAAFKYVIESPVENLRNLSKEIVEAIYKGFDQLAKRIYSQEKAKEKSEDFLLKVASIFMSTDNLERKLHGVTILADIYKKIKAKEFEKVTKKDLATLIEKDGLIEQIIKGHTQLITKSTELFKLMFEEGRMNEKNLQLLWTTMRKADLETKNALGAMLNEAFVEFSYSQSAYFLTKLSELEAKQITLDDIELAFKIATYFKSKPGDAAEGIKSLDDMAIRAFWRICSDNDINPDVVEKASTRLIQLVKFGEAITEDKKILEEAIINVKEGRGVLQSLKVIKELVSLGDAKANTKALCEGGIMEAVFTNIKDLKASIKEKAEKAGLDFKSLNEQTLATLIPKGTTFEEQILKRLRFIDFLLHQLHPPKEQMLGIIARIWDELVANPVVPQEPSLFKKWFVKFSGKEGEEFVDSEVLQEFFFDKIKMLYDGKPEASELLKTFLEIFYRINLLNKNIRETTLYYEGSVSSVMSDSSKQIVYEIESSPEFLAGIQALWELIEHTKDENISNELIEYITKLYVRQEGDKSGTGFKKYQGFMESFVNRIAYLYDKYTKEENWSTNPDSIRVLKRLLGLLMESVDLTESIYPVKPCSIDTLYRGEKVNLTIDNNIQVTYQSPKKIDLRVYANITLIEIKQKIAAELGRITWRNVSISRPSKKGDIKDKHNSRTLRDMRVRLGERLQSDNRPILIKTKEPLVANDQLTPRADQAFREVFRRYAKDGKMGPVETAKFGQCVLENNTIGPTDIKILDLIEKWDKDKDGSLSEEEFFEFYRSSSMNKASVVWQNLKSLGYGDDLLLLSAEEEWNEADLARFHIMKNTGLIQGLFKLVDRRDEIGQAAWDFFSRMPPIESEVQKITKLQSGWDDLKSGSVYKSMYTLYILDFLLEEDDKDAPDQTETSIGHVEGGIKQFRKKWREDFVKAGGFVTLLSILAQLVQKGVSSRLDMVLFSFILKSVSNYILAGATMNNTELYRDVAFIASGLPLSAFKQGKKQTQAKKDTPAKESLKNIIQKYAVDFNKANPLNPASVEMSAAQNQSNMQVESSQSPSAAVQTDTEPKAIGPENKTVFIGPSNDPEKDKENKEKNEKEKEVQSLTSKLNESEDFKQFRESLRQIGDTPLTRLDSIETLRFIAKLIQETLNKSSSVDLEEINIVKLSLSVFFCLLLSEPELLRKAIMTDEVKLLPEDSSFKIKGYSDLVSFLISGLLARRNFLFARYFSNAFSVIMLECGSKEVQTILVGAVHSQVMREDLPPKSQARYIELSCQIVDSICATGDDKDPKILLEKGDLNKIANLEEFFFRIIETVLDSKPIEVAPGETDYQNDLMISNFKILEKVLSVEPELKVKVGNKKSNDKSYIERIFNECLFNLKDDSSDSIEDSIKCKSTVTREACYDFLAELCSGNVQNSSELLTKGLDALCASIPTVKGWKYTPGRERKSPQGFLGINNLHNICYINAMIQQFYMTPVFRYGVLAAGEGEVKPPVLDKEGRPIDDHLLRQLQKLFAFLDKSERASYSPYEFCFSLKDPAGQPINVSIQQDTQEFLNIFFDKMENLLKPTPFKSLLSDVYGGKLIDMLGCTSCGHLRTTDQVFYNLSLEVKNFKNVKESLDKLTTQDIISDYKCEHCQQKCDVTKRPLVKECPNVLLVYLSRIIFDLDVLMNVKINTRYEFPFEFSLKDYTYDNFLREQEAEKKKNNPQANASQPQAKEQPNPNKLDGSAQPEGEATSELPPLQDADYQYTLAGVLVHRGSAEAGHYYSYINVNRLDPRRPRNNKDEWVEFNDSMIREFKLSQLEEECFGAGGKKNEGETAMDDEDTMPINAMEDDNNFKLFDNKDTSYGRSAYILVYEKKQKRPITVEFEESEQGKVAKEQLLQDVVAEEKKPEVSEEHTEGKLKVHIPYNGIKAYLPPALDKSVKEDNFRFLLEQQVYSKEFLTFVAKITTFPQLTDPLAGVIVGHIADNTLPEPFTDLLLKVLRIQMALFHTVISRSDESQCAEDITKNIIRIISYIPEHTSEIFREHFYEKFVQTLNLLFQCPEPVIRKCMGMLIAHIIIVHVRFFEIDIDTNFTVDSAELMEIAETKDFFEDRGLVIMTFLSRMYTFVLVNPKIPYKRLDHFFRLWVTLATNNKNINLWLLGKAGCIRKFIDFYMSKTITQYEAKNGFFVHEQSLEPLLQLICQLLAVMKAHNQEIFDKKLDKPYIQLTPEESQAVYSENFYNKILKENYAFNNFQSLRFLIEFNCTHNEMLSRVLIINILKSLHYWSETNISHFNTSHVEALKALLLIKDEYSEIRREITFGVPTVLDDVDFQRQRRFGFQCHRALDKASVNYFTPLKVGWECQSFLKLLSNAADRSDSTCYILIVYYLQIVNSDEKIFESLLRYPSPTHEHESLHQWIFGFVKSYIKRDREYYMGTYYRPSRQFDDAMKENLERYEDNLLNWARTKGGITPPESIFGDQDTCAVIYNKNPGTIEVVASYRRKEVGLCKNPIVGSVAGEDNERKYKVFSSNKEHITINVSQLRCRIVDSAANGITNLALPQSAFTGVRIYEQDIVKDSALSHFLNPTQQVNKQTKQQSNTTKDKTKEGLTKIPEDDLSDDSFSFGEQDKIADNPKTTTDKDDKLDFKFRENHLLLNIALALRMHGIEGAASPNLWLPKTRMNINLKSYAKDVLLGYFMKVDDAKKMGEFAIDVLFSEIEEAQAELPGNNLMFVDGVNPVTIEINKGEADVRTEESEGKTSEDE